MPYAHAPLQDDEFRILELLPSNGSVELTGTLHPSRAGSGHQYEALSYCWGDSKATESVYIDNEELKITQSLASALRHLRFTNASRFLWIDQICIDQQSIPERNHQVANLMGKIYTETTRLIIWLGDADETSEIAISTVKRACNEMAQNGGNCDFFKGDLSLVNLRDTSGELNLKPFIAARNLRARPWFSRAWVVQELCLPTTSQITVHCGSESLSWDDYAMLDNAMDRYAWHSHISEAPLEVRSVISAGSDLQPMEHTRQLFHMSRASNNSELSTLLSNLWYSRQFSCTIAKDKVYSFKHVGQDLTSQNLRIDYGISTTEAFTNVARAIIHDSKRLSIFGACQLEKNIPDLPSWVPDWTMGRTRRPLRQLTAVVSWEDPGWHRALPAMDARPVPSPSANELMLHGLFLHNIEIVSSDRVEPWKRLIELDTVALMVDLMIDVRSMAPLRLGREDTKAEPVATAPWDIPVTKRDLCIKLINEALDLWAREAAKGLSSLSEAAQGDTLFDTSASEKREVLDTAIDQIWSEASRPRPDRTINSNTITRAAFIILFPELEWESESHSDIWTTLVLGQDTRQHPVVVTNPYRNLPAFLFGMMPCMHGRKFFTTADHGDVGMGPYEIQSGDAICLFPGAHVPTVLRAVPGSDRWLVIGDCYYARNMDGKKGKAQLDEGAATTLFTLV